MNRRSPSRQKRNDSLAFFRPQISVVSQVICHPTNTMTGLWLKQSETAYRLIMIGYSQMKSGLLLAEKNWQKVKSSPSVH